MPAFTDLIRPFWLPGLNTISGKVSFNIRNWIIRKDYQIYQVLKKDSFVLTVSEPTSLLSAFAFDHSKMSIAALESIYLIEKNKLFPKSFSWLFIKVYYAAFYSAHAILRMLGVSLTHFGNTEASTINAIGSIFGAAPENLASGFYKCVFDSNRKTLHGQKLDASGGGSHEILWKVFHETVNDLSNKILLGHGLTIDRQKVSNKLSDICSNLAHGPCNSNKGWLSFIRNGITYRHEHSVWFPYNNQLSHYERFYDLVLLWKKDPLEISLYMQHGRDLQRFIETCCLLVSLLRLLDLDMANRCPIGKSFLVFGPISFLNKAGIND
ncbi:hypothetical protein LCGC14_2401220 [marine sediment metagenome]|uniref:Uncharacterized protein n=1 Tax=marine sediment metagenome TaxID=412755 RepID=A0A0F9BVA4_9ZZZZ